MASSKGSAKKSTKSTEANAGLPAYTVPSLTLDEGAQTAQILQARLHALIDLALTLKHIHWNVIGPHFIAVHEMIDPQVDAVQAMVDETAERIATLGSVPVGTPGAIVASRTWDDYSIGRASTIAHLGALDEVYRGFITDHREAATATEELDDVTNDMLIGQLGSLEQFHWFVRAHLESTSGELSTADARTEKGAARSAEADAKGRA